MAKTSLGKKLRIQPHQRILILNAPPGYTEALGTLPEGVEMADVPNGACVPEGSFDFVHLFVKNLAELERLGPVAIEAVTYDGLLWMSYPKQSSRVETDLTRDKGWDVMAHAGLRPVTQVAVDDTWSALRFRPEALVGKKSGMR